VALVMLEARDIAVTLGAKRLLDGVSLSLRGGEILALVGPNGAGKSTLLKVLSGEIAPSAGSVAMDGRPLAGWPALERARVRAVLAQDSTLAFPFTALEVALMGRYPFNTGHSTRRDRAIAREALAYVDVAHLAQRLYPTLSGGERQRVQLARVLAQIWEPHAGPRCLLLDEPTSGLDLAHQQQALKGARRFALEQGVAALVVLHDLNLAAQYAERIALLHQGRLVTCGSPREVLTAARLAEYFDVEAAILAHPRSGAPLVVIG
jgi:iron complex transport system ATP-binding protein